MSWRYNFLPNKHIPTRDYVNAVWKTYTWLYPDVFETSKKPSYPPFIYLASDSANSSTEFTDILTSNDTLVRLHGDEQLYPYVYSLRTSANEELRNLAPTQEYVQSQWNSRGESDRIRETRGVIVDWAIMSGAWRSIQVDAGELDFVLPRATVCALPYVVISYIPQSH